MIKTTKKGDYWHDAKRWILQIKQVKGKGVQSGASSMDTKKRQGDIGGHTGRSLQTGVGSKKNAWVGIVPPEKQLCFWNPAVIMRGGASGWIA